MIDRGILIVEADERYRKRLTASLLGSYSVVKGAASGPEATEIVTANPHMFHFAVIDHDLNSEFDGITTTRALIEACPHLYPVVFSNTRASSSCELMQNKFSALEAGAFRYLEWSRDHRKDIDDFIQEIEQLDHLRNWISEFFEARAFAPSLLTLLDIGMDIIDRHYKVWFMNDAMRRIIGIKGSMLPKAPCAAWHAAVPGTVFRRNLLDSETDSGGVPRIDQAGNWFGVSGIGEYLQQYRRTAFLCGLCKSCRICFCQKLIA